MVLIFSGQIMLLITYIANLTKLQWVKDFALSVSMVAGMAFAVLWRAYV